MTTTAINFLQIREDNDLKATVERYLGPPKNGKWLCPFHKEKTPSFSVKGDRFKCFGGCGLSGDVTDFVALIEKVSVKDAAQKLNGYILDLGMTPAEIRVKQAAIRAEYLAEEEKKRQQALKRVAGMTAKVEHYRSQVGQARDYWYSQGLRDSTIQGFKLGYCPNFPLWEESDGKYQIREFTPSYVIPYFHYGELVNIRHRLKGRDKDKYRPEFAGLPNQLFNIDALDNLEFGDDLGFGPLAPGEIILCEGEVKTMYLHQISAPAVGLPGAQAWQEQYISLFAHTSTVYVVLDPDAEKRAKEITRTLNSNGIQSVMVPLPQKVDDMFVKYGCSISDFSTMLQQGRRVL